MSTPETPIESARVTGVRIFPALRRESLDLNQLEGGISTINGDDIDNVSRGLSKGVEWRGGDYFFFKKFHCNNNYCCQIQFEEKDEDKHSVLIAGVPNWNIYNRKAFGISMSLYDQNPVNHKISGM